jgi:hypothetical protein
LLVSDTIFSLDDTLLVPSLITLLFKLKFGIFGFSNTVKNECDFPGVKRFMQALSGSGWRFCWLLGRLFHLSDFIDKVAT